MAIASVTRVRLRSNWYTLPFVFHALMSVLQARSASGCFAATATRRGQAFWTVTVWRDVEALRAFMMSGAHRKAMPHLVNWCDEASTARFEWTSELPPTWEDAEWRMAKEGRISPVKHPSPAHAGGNSLGEEGVTSTLCRHAPLGT